MSYATYATTSPSFPLAKILTLNLPVENQAIELLIQELSGLGDGDRLGDFHAPEEP